jgi:hypothetical protein
MIVSASYIFHHNAHRTHTQSLRFGEKKVRLIVAPPLSSSSVLSSYNYHVSRLFAGSLCVPREWDREK